MGTKRYIIVSMGTIWYPWSPTTLHNLVPGEAGTSRYQCQSVQSGTHGSRARPCTCPDLVQLGTHGSVALRRHCTVLYLVTSRYWYINMQPPQAAPLCSTGKALVVLEGQLAAMALQLLAQLPGHQGSPGMICLVKLVNGCKQQE